MAFLKNVKTLLYLCVFLFIYLPLTGCNDYTVRTDSHLNTLVEKSFETTSGKTFTLNAAFGDVFIETSDSPSVDIRISGNKEANDNTHFEFDNTEDGVTVIAKKKNPWNIFGLFHHMSLRFDVRLPKNYNAKISSSGGDIYVNNLDGHFSANTSGGDVSIKNTSGSIDIKTSGGDINAENTSGRCSLTTSGGDIKVSAFQGDLDAATSGGDVYLSGGNGKIDASTSGGEVNLNYSGENKGIQLSSSGGNISAVLPADFNADAKLTTSGGSISCKFKLSNVDKISSSKLEGQLNQGGLPLIIKTSGGDISVKQK